MMGGCASDWRATGSGLIGASAGVGGEISRLEGLSDAVFAFAVTLLVVSLEVPETFDELLHVLRGFSAFAVCFAILFWVWHDHYRFFRRYGRCCSTSSSGRPGPGRSSPGRCRC